MWQDKHHENRLTVLPSECDEMLVTLKDLLAHPESPEIMRTCERKAEAICYFLIDLQCDVEGDRFCAAFVKRFRNQLLSAKDKLSFSISEDVAKKFGSINIIRGQMKSAVDSISKIQSILPG